MTSKNIDLNQPFTVGAWQVDPASGALRGREGSRRLEPKVMALLCVLARRAPDVVTREELMSAVWPGQFVGEDALARSLLKLRRALGDEARNPRYIETLPRRGYRLLPRVEEMESAPEGEAPSTRYRATGWLFISMTLAAVVLAGLYLGWPDVEEENPLLARAHDHYYRFEQADNERAHLLYQRVLESQPDLSEAQAGLANTLIQRLIRWPEAGGPIDPSEQSVAAALDNSRLDSPWAQATLDQADLLVESAVRGDPDSGFAWKSHGLVQALRGQLDEAQSSYRRALEVDAENWEAATNLGELYMIAGQDADAIDAFERAYRSMDAGYVDSAQRIGPWQPELGVLIGALHRRMGADGEAERWYRRVLEQTPLHVDATLALAAARAEAGDGGQAEELCRELISRIGPLSECAPYLLEN
jgi:DNA-binding winged helix-turn-helix (wHTH) protein/Tfp pilus assembly protein PilF